MNEPWQRLPALSLKQLQYFVTLAQLRHFTDTANRLAISQPALYTTYLHDPALKVAQLQQPALTRTVALMRGPQALPPSIEECFSLLQSALR